MYIYIWVFSNLGICHFKTELSPFRKNSSALNAVRGEKLSSGGQLLDLRRLNSFPESILSMLGNVKSVGLQFMTHAVVFSWPQWLNQALWAHLEGCPAFHRCIHPWNSTPPHSGTPQHCHPWPEETNHKSPGIAPPQHRYVNVHACVPLTVC